MRHILHGSLGLAVLLVLTGCGGAAAPSPAAMATREPPAALAAATPNVLPSEPPVTPEPSTPRATTTNDTPVATATASTAAAAVPVQSQTADGYYRWGVPGAAVTVIDFSDFL